MSAAKRVVKLLSLADKRATQSALDSVKRGKDGRRYGREAGDERGRPGELDEAAKMAARVEGEEQGEVVVRGTGRAIEKVMGLGVWFSQREEYGVRIRTGSVGAVDDVVEKEGEGGVEMEGAEGEEDDGVEVPGSRIRYASTVEVVVSRR
ncbi:putative Rpp20 subunit of nuclear Rnase [Elsinoe australis]|uniref:Putative Rpp20 subunit of nuclear Rnase n=1 Tax=Elsinoe australis TaxID=40998 RepID=A0A4U7B204_9PEZI|nr:putative Rpp20 subunit of nuclear Rnase [Elsinoe australis]